MKKVYLEFKIAGTCTCSSPWVNVIARNPNYCLFCYFLCLLFCCYWWFLLGFSLCFVLFVFSFFFSFQKLGLGIVNKFVYPPPPHSLESFSVWEKGGNFGLFTFSQGRSSISMWSQGGKYRQLNCQQVEQQCNRKSSLPSMKRFSALSIVLLALSSLIVILLTVLKKGVPVVASVDSDPERLNVDSSVLRSLLWYTDTSADGWRNGSGYSLFGNDSDSDADVCYFMIKFYLIYFKINFYQLN